MRTFQRLLIVVLVSLFALSPVLVLGAETPKRGGTLVVGTGKDPQSLDNHKDMAIQGITVIVQILDGLLNIDDEGRLIPDLAMTMPEQADPITYVFTLRKGVKFHNGADFDARDVKFTFDRLMNKDISYFWKQYQSMIKSVDILDPYKIKVTLNKPNVTFLDMIGKYHELRIIPKGSPNLIEQPIGTGPFKFKEWTKDDHLTIVRNDQYWTKGQPYLDQIIYKPFPEPTTRMINLKTAKVDLVQDVPILDAVEMKKDPAIKVFGKSGGQREEFWMNTTKPPFDNKKARQGILYGMDREAIAQSVLMGYAEASQDLFPSWHWAHNPSIKAYPYDPEKAKALLAEAGYSGSRPLSFTIMCVDPIFVDQAVVIQAHLAKIGVKVTIMPVEKSYRVDASFGRNGRDYEVLIVGASDDMTDLQWVYSIFDAKAYFNWSGYNSERYGKKGVQNPEVDRLLQEVIKTSDRNQARKMYDQIQKMIIEDVPMLPLSYFQNIIAIRDYVKNHKCLTRNTIPLKEVWVESNVAPGSFSALHR